MNVISKRSARQPSSGGGLRVAGLFAGIGGIELGLHAAGHSTEVLCELDPGATRVLKKSFPGVRIVRDVRRMPTLPVVDLVSAGFPCQDLSQAGRTAGIRGKNSSLVGQVFRLLDSRDRGPRWLLLENVPFMLQLERGRAMRFLVDELEARGFTWAYRVVDTRAFGLPQRRHRVILVASKTEDPRCVLFSDDAKPTTTEFDPRFWCGFFWTEGLRGLGWAVDAVPTLKTGSTIGIPSPPAIWDPSSGSFGTPEIRDAERLQGFPAEWTEPALEANGVRPGHRWKLVGNAVSVPVAKWVGSRLAVPGQFNSATPTELLERGVAWPRAAWGRRGKVYSVGVSTWPVRRRSPHLKDFLHHELLPLSARAATGFHNRASVSGLSFVDGFLDAVRRHADRMKMVSVA